MPAAVETGITSFGGMVNAPGNTGQSQWIFFGPTSASTTSHLLNVNETAVVIRAYNLISGEGADIVTVNMVDISSTGLETINPLIIKTKQVLLTASNNAIVLDMAGYYRFTLNNEGSLGLVLVVGIPSALSYWSYGLSEFVAT